MKESIGLTKDAGWQFGIRKTFPLTVNMAWDFLLSDEGVPLWLGKVKSIEWTEGKSFKTSSGDEGILSVVKSDSHLRMKWKKNHWKNFSQLQVRVIRSVGKCVIAFHHDNLENENQREEMKEHWKRVISNLESKLKS